MRYRRLDASDDYQFGRGQADFLRDVPDAPAQAVRTRLALWMGEWFLDLREGTAWTTKVLGNYTGSTRDPVLRARIAGTQGVSSIAAYASQVNRDTRGYTVQVTVDTIYDGAATASIPVTISQPVKPAVTVAIGTSDGNLLGTSDGSILGAQR